LTGFSGHLACAGDGISVTDKSAAAAMPASARTHFDVVETLKVTVESSLHPDLGLFASGLLWRAGA
jgi:hypothetical protein